MKREALRDFDCLKIIVGQPEELLIDVELSRSMRFFLFNALDSTSTPDVTGLVKGTWNALVHPPGGVTLTVSAPDSRANVVTAASRDSFSSDRSGSDTSGERFTLAICTGASRAFLRSRARPT